MLQPTVAAVQPLPEYRLLVEYTSGEKRVFRTLFHVMTFLDCLFSMLYLTFC